MQKIVLATLNKGKVHEFNDLFHDSNLSFIAQSEYKVPEIDETGVSFVENAILKARHASRLTGLPALADDSGLFINALNGAPGIYSARYAGGHGNSVANIAKVLTELKNVPLEQRQAKFVCCLVYVAHADDELMIISQATWKGSILMAPIGDKGFGYDPIFYVPEFNCSAAELDAAVKNRISHRARAVAEFNLQWKDYFCGPNIFSGRTA